MCRWLSTQHDDGSISRLLSAGSSRPLMVYKLLVTTSDLRGAGTDANVWVQLHGFLGEGLQHQLLGGATAFDRCVPDSESVMAAVSSRRGQALSGCCSCRHGIAVLWHSVWIKKLC